MSRLLILIALLLASACSAGSAFPSPTSPGPGRLLGAAEAERLVGASAREALAALRARDGARLASLAHPGKGVLFSPYAYVHPADDVVLRADELRTAFSDPKVRAWGTTDGRGDTIELTFAKYFERWVYDVDFAAAPTVAYNREVGRGNISDNTATAFPDAVMVEQHFEQIDPRYGGMDWRSLRLLFEETGGAWKLVAVVHAEWTI